MTQFPIDPWLDAISAATKQKASVLIKAEPGAGKTTRVPPRLLADFRSVLVIQPRRLAAKLTATWVAEQRGTPLGQEVGFQIRLENRASNATKLLFVTEGVFTRKLLEDPLLKAWDVIILDEFHERHLQTDLALAAVRRLQRARPDLKLIIMSATLDTTSLESWLGGCERFDIAGKTFPVQTEYHPLTAREDLSQGIARSVNKLLHDGRTSSGNILVFLPGMAEIRRTEKQLQFLSGHTDVIALSAELATNYALISRDPERRKIILSTNVAETSLTMPGVTGVIDTGLARILGQAEGSGLPTLKIQRVSQASCIQRAGRAGRTAPGVCHRLFTEMDFASRAEFTTPEIRRIDLCQMMLELAAIFPEEVSPWDNLPWFEVPEPRILAANFQLLQQLGALDREGRLTPAGKQMAALPLHPRLSRMVLHGLENSTGEQSLLGALVINEGMILRGQGEPDYHHHCDASFQSELLLAGKQAQRQAGVDLAKARRIKELYERMAPALGLRPLASLQEIDEVALRRAIFFGFADRVARYRPLADRSKLNLKPYNFCIGRGGSLVAESVVKGAEWIVVIEAKATTSEDPTGTKGKIYAACAIDPAWLQEDPFTLRHDEVVEETNPKNTQPQTIERTYYGKLLLVEKVLNVAPAKNLSETLVTALQAGWPTIFGDTSALDRYHKRLKLLEQHKIPHKIPYFTGEMLDFLLHYLCEGAKNLDEVKRKSLGSAIAEQLDYEDQKTLDDNCPLEIKLSNGQKLKVHYDEEQPWITGKIQEFFGQQDTPTICQGRQPLLCKLLAPSRRPAQITSQLRQFWQGSYHDIKKELKRRYPKHPWPDNPESSLPPERKPRGSS